MGKYHRTIVIFNVKDWPARNLFLYYDRYISPLIRGKSDKTISFEVVDFMLAVITFVLDARFLSHQEAAERLDDFLDLYFVNRDDTDNEIHLLSASDRYKLTCYIEDMAEVIAYDLLNTFKSRELRYNDNTMIDDVLLRNDTVSFVLNDLERETW
ncbi:hypothetical protein MOC16_gp326 [Klebsiella phage vB_KpM_FBKp24]|uniref:Uncharacterized protein n=1 Tax=Klebsiella phage vB_KpM_FBKp24 TaxID=2801834 RepID=A0A7U0GBN0_9CAUD|nr:hypothetical protein [Klebsiella pneumoniae]YP_010298724.1 hypothetical protein MOC16_gp326 [Klebsiella phage vB_KpM_FBKp24]QQV92198.1 hypothetical protein vBKpMFBKp24_087 [Klebsiella phage vB_KpM_FBKp24]